MFYVWHVYIELGVLEIRLIGKDLDWFKGHFVSPQHVQNGVWSTTANEHKIPKIFIGIIVYFVSLGYCS